MQRKPSPTRASILAVLREGPARLSTLCAATNVKRSSVRSAISRLRDEGFAIFTETTDESGDPRYRLLAEPNEILQ